MFETVIEGLTMSEEWLKEQIQLTKQALEWHKTMGLYTGHLEFELNEYNRILNK